MRDALAKVGLLCALIPPLMLSISEYAYAQEDASYAFDVGSRVPYKGAPVGHVGINDIVSRPVDPMGYLYGIAIGGVFTYPYVVASGDIAVSRIFYGKDTDVVLVRAVSGENAHCRYQYAFIRVPIDGRQATGSPFFGTCARLEDIRQRGDDIMIVMPDKPDRMKNEGRTRKYVYALSNGVMKDNGVDMDMTCHTNHEDTMCYTR